MKLVYYYNINKVKYYELDKWFKEYIRQYKWALLQYEIKLIKKENCLRKGVITIKLDDELNVCLYLYILGECIDEQSFNLQNLTGIGAKITKMLLQLRDDD